MEQLRVDGKVGGKGSELARAHGSMGGRPRKPRVAEEIAKRARDNADLIWSAYKDALENESVRTRMDAANAVIKIERDEDRLRLDEDKALDQLSDDELTDKIMELMEHPMFLAMIGEGTEGEVVPYDADDAA